MRGAELDHSRRDKNPTAFPGPQKIQNGETVGKPDGVGIVSVINQHGAILLPLDLEPMRDLRSRPESEGNIGIGHPDRFGDRESERKVRPLMRSEQRRLDRDRLSLRRQIDLNAFVGLTKGEDPDVRVSSLPDDREAVAARRYEFPRIWDFQHLLGDDHPPAIRDGFLGELELRLRNGCERPEPFEMSLP